MMSYTQHKLNHNNQKMMDCELPLLMIHVSLILQHNMGMKYAEEPFNMGMFFLPKVSFTIGTFLDPQPTHPGIFIPHPTPLPLTQVQALQLAQCCPMYLVLLGRYKMVIPLVPKYKHVE